MKFSIFAILAIFALTACTDTPTAAAQVTASATKSTEAAIRNVSPAEAQGLIGSVEGLVILDVRTPEEFSAGHIAGAINIDFYDDDFEAQLSALDRSTPYLMHCRSGGRSSKALKIMKKLGFEDIAHLNSGFNGWQQADMPITTD